MHSTKCLLVLGLCYLRRGGNLLRTQTGNGEDDA